MSRSRWRPVYVTAVFLALSIAFLTTPETFTSPARGGVGVELAGWLGLLAFGPATVLLAVYAVRNGRRR